MPVTCAHSRGCNIWNLSLNHAPMWLHDGISLLTADSGTCQQTFLGSQYRHICRAPPTCQYLEEHRSTQLFSPTFSSDSLYLKW